MELRGYVQTFETGQLSAKSIVANLHWTPKNKLRKINETSHKNYAELWIGTHVNGEATLRKTKEKLSKFLAKHPHVLGVSSYLFKDKLPFLLKVLSIASPQPIKIHPSERVASILHKINPSRHPDSVHQPVLYVALSDVEFMAGFRPRNEIMFFIKNVPELNGLIKPNLLKDFERTEQSYHLKKIFECYMNTEKDKLNEAINKYFNRMETEHFEIMESHIFELVEKLQKLVPYDYGVFMIFFMNHFFLEKDEAIYIRPLVPYSLLYGDAVECTTNSNNDIPLTFTSDTKEVSLFVEYADYTSYEMNQLKLKSGLKPDSIVYDCDENEFVLFKVTIAKDRYYSILGKRTICVFIIIKGMAMTLERTKIKVGTIMLIPSSYTFHMRALEDMTLFMVEPNLVI